MPVKRCPHCENEILVQFSNKELNKLPLRGRQIKFLKIMTESEIAKRVKKVLSKGKPTIEASKIPTSEINNNPENSTQKHQPPTREETGHVRGASERNYKNYLETEPWENLSSIDKAHARSGSYGNKRRG